MHVKTNNNDCLQFFFFWIFPIVFFFPSRKTQFEMAFIHWLFTLHANIKYWLSNGIDWILFLFSIYPLLCELEQQSTIVNCKLHNSEIQ